MAILKLTEAFWGEGILYNQTRPSPWLGDTAVVAVTFNAYGLGPHAY